MRIGYAEEVVLGWSRDQLLSKYAELLIQGWDPATAVRSVDPELEKARMAHEKEMERQKNELREKELNAERERNELERQRNEQQGSVQSLRTRGSRGLCANENCNYERVWPYCEMLFGQV